MVSDKSEPKENNHNIERAIFNNRILNLSCEKGGGTSDRN
jgi:hypothetical protein